MATGSLVAEVQPSCEAVVGSTEIHSKPPFLLSLTFFDSMHVILAMTIPVVVPVKVHRGGWSATEHTGVETVAFYWRMVDLEQPND